MAAKPIATVKTSALTSSKTPRRYSVTRTAPATNVGRRKRTRTPTTSLRSRFQRRTDRLQDFCVPERLGDVGRGSELQPLEDLDFLPFRAEHDHGDGSK